MNMKQWALMCALSASVLAGCAHRKPPAVPQNAPQDTTYTRQNESFDPLTVKDKDALKLPDSRLKASGGSSGKTSTRSKKGTHEALGSGFSWSRPRRKRKRETSNRKPWLISLKAYT